MADLAHALFGDADLQAKEGLALLNSNAFSTGIAALAVADATSASSRRWTSPARSTSRRSPPT